MWLLGILQKPALKGKFILPVASDRHKEVKAMSMVRLADFPEDSRWAAQQQVRGDKYSLDYLLPPLVGTSSLKHKMFAWTWQTGT